jgi:cytochrome oxidase Cu insertion factor (SCO1/SenC/PrrC family)
VPGMGQRGVNLTNGLTVAAFHHSVYVVALYWIIAITVVLLIGAALTRRLPRFNLSPAGLSEPRARTVLRVGFGILWCIDGLLQFQPAMPLGLANNVVAPTVAGTPSFFRPVLHHAISLWNLHPIALATGVAWIQVGIGLALICSNGITSRVVGLVAAGWALLVWSVGNGLGGVFASGASILFGWPGAVLFYLIAGVWIACTPRFFHRWFTLVTTRLLAVVLVVGAILQMLPNAGFWRGGNANALTSMTRAMASLAEPHPLSWVVRHVGDLAGLMGGGFNIVVVMWLLGCAGGLWWASTHPVTWPFVALWAGCLFFWITAEDVAIFGGVGTDVNSMVPLAFLAWAARPALRARAPYARQLPQELRSNSGSVVASFAAAMVLFSSVSMLVATASPAEATLFLAANGSVGTAHSRATPFTLTDQFGHAYRLGEHPGHYTILSFLDPVCWTDCPLIAGQLKAVRQALGPSAPLDIVAVAANPEHQTLANVRHFIAIHDMGSVKGFYFVTGPLAETRSVWNTWGIGVSNEPGVAMSIHSDYMYVIDPRGYVRWIIPDDPLGGGGAQQTSTVQELLSLLAQVGLR